MGCFKAKTQAEENGPKCLMVKTEDRKCRDVLCCIIFLVFWIGMGIVAIIGLKFGSPDKLKYAPDYEGNLCGVGANAERPLVVYPRIADDLVSAYKSNIDPLDASFFGVCVSSCPTVGQEVCTYDKSHCWNTYFNTTAIFHRCLPGKAEQEIKEPATCIDPEGGDPNCTPRRQSDGKCTNVCRVKTQRVVSYVTSRTEADPLMQQLEGGLQILGRWANDLLLALPVILGCGIGLAFSLSLILILLMRFVAGFLVLLSMCSVTLCMILLCIITSLKSGLLNPESPWFTSLTAKHDVNVVIPSQFSVATSNKLFYECLAYVSIGATVLLLAVLIAMHQRVWIAVGIIKEASRCIKVIPSLILWPIVPIVASSILAAYWLYIAAFIGSASLTSEGLNSYAKDLSSAVNISNSDLEDLIKVKAMPGETLSKYLLLYHFFGLLWTNQVIEAISICTMAGAVGSYYWSREDEKGNRDVGRTPVLTGLYRSLRFHLGSLCFGAFIIAVVQFIRAVLAYIDHNTKELQQSNFLIKILMKVVQCCMWLFEKILKFISKNAYIYIAMKGESFCSSTVAAMSLILKNMARIGVVSFISMFVLLLCKISVSVGASVVTYQILSQDPDYDLGGEKQLSNVFLPVVFTFIIAYTISSVSLGVYETTIDTILVCFCEDATVNDGGDVYMSPELAGYISQHSVQDKDKDGKKAPNENKAAVAPKAVSDVEAGGGEVAKQQPIAWGSGE